MKVNWFWTGISSILTIALIFSSLYYSYSTVKLSGPVLTNNWWEALNWIKQNTPECAVIATYWDPGHFITGIAQRPVVFDGASQNSRRTITLEGNLSEEEIKNIIGIDNFLFSTFEKDGKIYTNVTTARIQDIATTLFTNNETQAIKILQRYVMPKCNKTMYYIASADLIGKSQWWTYFATWKPGKKGKKYYYYPLSLSNVKKIDNYTVYVYPITENQAFLVYEKGNELFVVMQQGMNTMKVKKFFYFTNTGGIMKKEKNATINGLAWLDPSKQILIYVPEELVDSLFTKMFLFDGAGLKHFKFIKNFGGEVKIFKVNFENS